MTYEMNFLSFHNMRYLWIDLIIPKYNPFLHSFKNKNPTFTDLQRYLFTTPDSAARNNPSPRSHLSTVSMQSFSILRITFRIGRVSAHSLISQTLEIATGMIDLEVRDDPTLLFRPYGRWYGHVSSAHQALSEAVETVICR